MPVTWYVVSIRQDDMAQTCAAVTAELTLARDQQLAAGMDRFDFEVSGFSGVLLFVLRSRIFCFQHLARSFRKAIGKINWRRLKS